MRISLASCLLVFCRCAGSPPTHSHRVDVPWPVKSSKKPSAMKVTSDLMDHDAGSPNAVLREGERTKDDAKGYVLAPQSKSSVIDRLTELSRAYDAARTHMDEQMKARGYFSKGDLEAVRRAADRMKAALEERDEAQ